MNWKIAYIAWVLFAAVQALAQEDIKEEESALKGSHRLTTGLGHTHLSKGKNADGKTVWLLEPSWSLNYDHWLSNKWAIGLQTDLVLEKFIVEDENGQEVKRERPWAVIPVGLFKPWKHFSFIAGAGIELEKKENMGLTRLGAEYGVELPKGWEAGMAVMWDNKWGNYNSWVFEFSFSKIFYKKHR